MAAQPPVCQPLFRAAFSLIVENHLGFLSSVEKREASHVGALQISSTNWKSSWDITDMKSKQKFFKPGVFFFVSAGLGPHPPST